MSDLPFQAEYSKSGRAKCKGCKETIEQGKLRLAAMVQSAFFDGKQPNWYHEECFFKKQRPKSVSEISQLQTLRQPDRERVIAAVESLGSGVVLPIPKGKGKGKKRANGDKAGSIAGLQDFRVEYAKSSRSTCKVCDIKICKDEVRICKVVFDTEVGQKYGGQPLWHHVNCFNEARSDLMFWASGEDLPGFAKLSKADQALVKKGLPPLKNEDVPIKKLKEEEKDPDEVKQEQKDKKAYDAQDKLFFRHRDSLKKHLSKADFQFLLESNGQEIPPGEERCLDRVADCMAFGALMPCSVCKNGQLVLETHGYICTGNISEWTKCSNVTRKPERKPFVVPKKYKKDVPTFTKYKPKVSERIFIIAAPVQNIVKVESELVKPKAEKPPPPLKNLNFFIHKSVGKKDETKHKILKLGGIVVSSILNSLAAAVSTEKEVEKMSSKMEEIKQNDIQVVDDSFFDLIKKDSGTIAESIQLIIEKNIASWGSDPTKRISQDVIDGKSVQKSGSIYTKSGKSTKTKLRVKGGLAVDPESELDDVAHVYIDRLKTKYSVVLGLTDVVSGKNSFYKLQVLESDHHKKYWLFRSWGRIGTTIGGNKTEKFDLASEACTQFETLYEEKSGNSFSCSTFTKVPGKMCPIEVDYGDEETAKVTSVDVTDNVESKLHANVQNLVKMIFDVNEMKKVMLEFELDTEKMPLGKLSRKQITAGYKVLSSLLKILQNGNDSSKQAKIVDSTNRFYTLIPHDFGVNNPPLLDNEEAVGVKTNMLDNLLELEIAYNMLTSGSEGNSSTIDAHYIKLKTEIVPLVKGSPEYELLDTYVKNTHAKTHSQYGLEIFQVFKVVREGEEKRFKPFKKLDNRRLLWHGSRTTNFAGILSQGLRIAPPEAPVSGYMFGKGIYFADMVSKSANYCCTNRSNPYGVMLLCEVALGKMKECHQSEYVTKLPAGLHSTWGMGRTEPDPKMQHVLDDGVIIPLGTPINKKISTSLLYNEFIVYDVAQVNVKYLFQMKFDFRF